MNTVSYTDTTTVTRRLLPFGIVVALAAVTGACAARGGAPVPRPFPGAALPPGAGETVSEPPPSVTYPELINTALQYRGVPYRNGGSDPSGFDCSGLVQWVYARHGTSLPREVEDQYRAGRKIDLEDVEPGDLIFFETVARGASHVGVVIGEGRFLHAPSSNGVVRIEPYNANYWIRRFVGARRVK